MIIKRKRTASQAITLAVTAHLRRHRPHTFQTITTAADANASLKAHARAHGKADLILADYPWKMGGASNGFLATVSPEAHYPTMSPKALLGLNLDLVCAKDAVIGFWALVGQMPLAYRILDRYGFDARTAITWNKVRKHGGRAVIPAGGAAFNNSE